MGCHFGGAPFIMMEILINVWYNEFRKLEFDERLQIDKLEDNDKLNGGWVYGTICN